MTKSNQYSIFSSGDSILKNRKRECANEAQTLVVWAFSNFDRNYIQCLSPAKNFELPEVLNRRKRKKPCIHKRICGKSIDERPAKVAARDTFGHWESDTVVGRKRAGEAAVFTIARVLYLNPHRR